MSGFVKEQIDQNYPVRGVKENASRRSRKVILEAEGGRKSGVRTRVQEQQSPNEDTSSSPSLDS